MRSGSLLLAALIVVCSSVLVFFGKLDGKDLIALVGQALGVAGVGRMMTFPSATTTTKETDASGKVTETKTQQPLGMPPPVPVTPPVPTPVNIVSPTPVPVDVVEPPKGATP